MKATRNRFAELDVDNNDIDPQKETIDESLELTGPVTYAVETSKWSLGGAISHLHQFRLQNITADKRSTLFLRFAHEAQAKKVMHWLTHEMKINAKIKRVQNSLGDQKCYYCHQLGHWGSECQESLLSMFPSVSSRSCYRSNPNEVNEIVELMNEVYDVVDLTSHRVQELITLISADLPAQDLFDFMLCSKSIFNAIANRQKTIIVARPHWHTQYRMKLKLGLLKHFKIVEKLVLRSLKCVETAIPIEVIATKYTKLTSLTINNCQLWNASDSSSLDLLDESWVTKIARMTQLKKLDLDCQPISKKAYGKLVSTTHLTQLRVSVKFSNVYYDQVSCTIPSGLKKLSMRAFNSRFTLSDLSPSANQLQSLYLYDVALGTEVKTLPALERLIVKTKDDLTFDAPNVTKLSFYSTSMTVPNLKNFHKLKTLLLDRMEDEVDFSGLLELRKLTLSNCSEAPMDLSPLINLKELHLEDPKPNTISNIPDSLRVLRVTLNRYSDKYELASTELAALQITRFECLVSESHKLHHTMKMLPVYLSELEKCSTLQELKVEFDDKRILPYYAKLTNLKVLDLVKSSKSSGWIGSILPQPSTPEDILELSKQLPNTRIYYGHDLPTSIQRPKEGHWYYTKLEESYMVPFDCGCEYCKALERGYFEEQFDSSRNNAINIGPKPFKEHWSWY